MRLDGTQNGARKGIGWVPDADATALPLRHAVRRQGVRRLHHRRRRRRRRPPSRDRLRGQQCGSPPLHPGDRNRTKYSLSSPARPARVSRARTRPGDRVWAHEHARSGISARTQSASRGLLVRAEKSSRCILRTRSRDKLMCARVHVRRESTHVCIYICVCAVGTCTRVSTALARTPRAVPQELQQFRKATTMIAVEGNRLHALKIRRTTPNVEEELVNAQAGQKLFCPLLS